MLKTLVFLCFRKDELVLQGYNVILAEQSHALIRAELKANFHISHFVYTVI